MAIAATAVLIAGYTWMQPAQAHVWQSNATGCNPSDGNAVNSADSSAHGYWYNSGLSADMQLATNYARQYSLDPTNINTFYVSALAADTDVVVYDQDYSSWCTFTNWHPVVDQFGKSTIGLSQCVSLATSVGSPGHRPCEKNEVRYDESWTTTTDVWSRIALACHENGHTLGLEHYYSLSTSCMTFIVDPSRNAFNGTDATWINSHYP